VKLLWARQCSEEEKRWLRPCSIWGSSIRMDEAGSSLVMNGFAISISLALFRANASKRFSYVVRGACRMSKSKYNHFPKFQQGAS